jgi:hypothetical protein
LEELARASDIYLYSKNSYRCSFGVLASTAGGSGAVLRLFYATKEYNSTVNYPVKYSRASYSILMLALSDL